MKKNIEFESAGKKYSLLYTIKSLQGVERFTGRSLVLLIEQLLTNPAAANQVNITFTVGGIQYGLQGQNKDFDAYEWVDKFCDNGGVLNDLNSYILQGILATGLFTRGTAKETEALMQTVSKLLSPKNPVSSQSKHG